MPFSKTYSLFNANQKYYSIKLLKIHCKIRLIQWKPYPSAKFSRINPEPWHKSQTCHDFLSAFPAAYYLSLEDNEDLRGVLAVADAAEQCAEDRQIS